MSARTIVVAAALALLSGCALPPMKPTVEVPVATPKSALRVALIVPQQTRRLRTLGKLPGPCFHGYDTAQPYGEVFEQSMRIALSAVFEQVDPVADVGAAGRYDLIFEASLTSIAQKVGCLLSPPNYYVATGSLRRLAPDGTELWRHAVTSKRSDFDIGELITFDTAAALQTISRHNARAIAALVETWVGELKTQGATARGPAPPGAAQDAAATAAGVASLGSRPRPGGLYRLETRMVFNVLDGVAFDRAAQTVVLIGHRDSRHDGPRIPYLQHLAELLEHPAPELSLDWTPESERAIDAFFARMDSPAQMAGLSAITGDWFDGGGLPNVHGRRMLKLFGIEPVKDGRAPGYLGIHADQSYRNERGVRVTRVDADSPAARAGVRPGDVLFGLGAPYLESTRRAIRRAGAGARVEFSVYRGENVISMSATLGDGQGDPWLGVDRIEMVAMLLENAGNQGAAHIITAIGDLQRHHNTPLRSWAFSNLFVNANINRLGHERAINVFYGITEQVRQGQRSEADAVRELSRTIVAGIEHGLAFPAGSLTSIFDRWDPPGRPASMNARGYDEAIKEVNRRIKPLVDSALRSAMQRRAEVVLPVSDVEKQLGTRPVVVPRFDGVDPRSQLARTLFEADYLGKSLLFDPDLAKQIPRYRTEFAFHADGRAASRRSEERRMWISIGSIGLAQSAAGDVLAFGKVGMRFNIRDAGLAPGVTANADSYAALLTSLYDEFALRFPVLHELREAAKLAAAARWIRSQDPGFRLPVEGRVAWDPPTRASGAVYLIWSPQRANVAMTAPGGVSLEFPEVPTVGPAGPVSSVAIRPPRVDASVVDLSDVRREFPRVALEPWDNAALRRVLAHRIEVPVPRQLGEVARATKGERYAAALRRPPMTGQCDPEKSAALTADLVRARDAAERLERVERVINQLNARNVGRQQAYRAAADELAQARDQFMESAYDLLTQGMLDAYDSIDADRVPTSLAELKSAGDLLSQAHKELDAVRERLERIRRTIDGLAEDDMESRNRAAAELLDLTKELVGGAAIKGSGPAARAMRGALRALNEAQRVVDILEFGAPLVTLASATVRLDRLESQTEADLRALSDKLLPLQRTLSDRLDAARKSPVVRAWLEGDARAICAS